MIPFNKFSFNNYCNIKALLWMLSLISYFICAIFVVCFLCVFLICLLCLCKWLCGSCANTLIRKLQFIILSKDIHDNLTLVTFIAEFPVINSIRECTIQTHSEMLVFYSGSSTYFERIRKFI